MKPSKLNKGDKVAIISLSAGILNGESKQVDLGIKRLEDYGLFLYLLKMPELIFHLLQIILKKGLKI